MKVTLELFLRVPISLILVASILVAVNIDGSAIGRSAANNATNQIIQLGIIQGTGSLQLDFKSFGVIFPDFKTRNGVNQRGWFALSANAKGYPAFTLPAGPKMYLVDRVRDLDPQNYDIQLWRNTGLVLSLGGCNGSNGCPPIYLCNSNVNSGTPPYIVSSLKDPPGVTLPATSVTSGKYVGWRNIVFCSATQDGINPTDWWTKVSMANLNSLFMVARGQYDSTGTPYAQTITYQAIFISYTATENKILMLP